MLTARTGEAFYFLRLCTMTAMPAATKTIRRQSSMGPGAHARRVFMLLTIAGVRATHFCRDKK
jgi:hypothetical protein